MNRTAAFAAAIATLVASTAPAMAQQAAPAHGQTAPIQVMLCDVDALSQPAFRSVNGARPVFVTADQVLAARASGARWEAPRCMNAVQHQRLTQRLGARVELRASL